MTFNQTLVVNVNELHKLKYHESLNSKSAYTSPTKLVIFFKTKKSKFSDKKEKEQSRTCLNHKI